MVSKAEKSRRQQARGTGGKEAAVPTSDKSVAIEKTAPNAQKTESVQQTTKQSSTTTATNTVKADITASNIQATTLRLPKNAMVDVWRSFGQRVDDSTVILAEEFVISVPSQILEHCSGRFVKEIPKLTKLTDKTYKWLIPEDTASKPAIFYYLQWFNTIRVPFPSKFKHTKQFVPKQAWGIAAIGALFRFSQWLELKAPLDNAILYGRCRDYVMDSDDKHVYTVIDIWKGIRTPLQERLKAAFIDRCIQWVEKKDYEDNQTIDGKLCYHVRNQWVKELLFYVPDMHEAWMKREVEIEEWRARVEKRAEKQLAKGEKELAEEEWEEWEEEEEEVKYITVR